MSQDNRKILCIYTREQDKSTAPDSIIPSGVPTEASMKWAPGIVTWKLLNETTDIPDGEMVHTCFSLAFTYWGLFTRDIHFKRVYGAEKADITIQFKVSDPGLPSPSTLAYTYYPNPNAPAITSVFNNDLHLIWSIDGKPITCAQALKQGNATGCVDPNQMLQTISLLNTATHEMGHAIGLVHTTDCPTCIMYPFYNGEVSLKPEEINNVELLYGKRSIPQHVIDSFASIMARIKKLGKYI